MAKVWVLCFTVNNYDGSEISALQAWDQLSYACVGKEVRESGM